MMMMMMLFSFLPFSSHQKEEL
jgi:hypothetical protein